ncbi:MAG TPA: hypothetical protein H9858_10515 [Candidatus Blautia stercoravium]|nr:hypothetical protein [Candidatus Blautia stercoravium]
MQIAQGKMQSLGSAKKGAAQIFVLFCYLMQYFTLIKYKNTQNNQTFAQNKVEIKPCIGDNVNRKTNKKHVLVRNAEMKESGGLKWGKKTRAVLILLAKYQKGYGC